MLEYFWKQELCFEMLFVDFFFPLPSPLLFFLNESDVA